MNKTATVSDCGRYRYSLGRTWDESQPPLVFVMLNPSTADAETDDPTIRKCIGFAQRTGFGGIVVVNLFAWRATDPRDMLAAWNRGENVVGRDNVSTITSVVRGRVTVLAWGAHARRSPSHAQAVENVVRLHASVVRALRLLDDGTPAHPLMLPYDCAKHMVAL